MTESPVSELQRSELTKIVKGLVTELRSEADDLRAWAYSREGAINVIRDTLIKAYPHLNTRQDTPPADAVRVRLADSAERGLQAMAQYASVPMDLWDRFSNDVLKLIALARLSSPRQEDEGFGASDAESAATRGPTRADQTGEEFLEFKEALDEVRGLRAEYECLNGGGPGWAARNKAAWAKIDELFANEDEAAYDRQQEDFYG